MQNKTICLWFVPYTGVAHNQPRNIFTNPLRWRHNDRDGVSNHQPHDCLLNRLFGRISKKTSKLRVTGLCAGNSPWTGEFPAQRASNAENVSINLMTSSCAFYPMMVLYMLVSRIPIQLSFRKYIRCTHLVLFPDTDMQGADAWLVSHDIQGAVYIQKWTRLLLMSLRHKEPIKTSRDTVLHTSSWNIQPLAQECLLI